MYRTKSMSAISRVIIGLLFLLAASLTKAADRPNVLLIVCDDFNTHVAPAGYEPIHTPVMKQFATEAQTFQRAFCQYPVCGPSRASFMSGLYPESTGVLDNTADIRQTRPKTVSLPQYFKQHGYWTGGVGKLFHTPKHDPGDAAWNINLRFDNDELPNVRAVSYTHLTLPTNREV